MSRALPARRSVRPGQRPPYAAILGVAVTAVAMTPAAARAAVQLTSASDPAVLPGALRGTWLSPTGDRVVFSVQTTATGRIDLYSRPIDASGPAVRLTGDSASDPLFNSFAGVSPDGQYVVFDGHEFAGQYRVQVYGRRIDASSPVVQLTDTGEPNWSTPTTFAFRPGSGHELVRDRVGTTTENDKLQLLSADGSVPVRQFSPEPSPNSNSIQSFGFSPGGTHALYVMYGSGAATLYSTDLRPGGATAKLNVPLPFTSNLYYQPTSDGQRVMYIQQPDVGSGQIYTRPIDGSGSPVAIGAPFRRVTASYPFQLAPNGRQLAFALNTTATGSFSHLYVAPSDGSAPATRLTTWDVADYQFTADSSRVVYSADVDNNVSGIRVTTLYSQLTDGGPAVQLYQAANTAGYISQFTLAGDRVLFFGEYQQSFWSVPIDGSAPASLIVQNRTISNLTLSPDGQLALFETKDTRYPYAPDALYALSINDGAVRRLSPDLVGSGYLGAPQITADGRWALYTASDTTTGGAQLFAVMLPEPGTMLATGIMIGATSLRRRRY